MWNFVVLTVMLALAGGYAVLGERDYFVQQQDVAAATAEGMAVYRGAVVRYYADPAHQGLPPGSVSLDTLRTAGVVPAWSTLQFSLWGNYRDAAGVIYVYATVLPATNMTTDLVRMAYGSMLAGSYHSATGTLYAPSAGDTGISLAALAALNVPDGAPVWIAAAP